MPSWDPTTYLQFDAERSRPFLDLLARVPGNPRAVVDLGCGAGNLAAPVRERWPGVALTGIDSSPEMIAAARATDPSGTYVQGDLRTTPVPGRPDLIVTNAALQWVPGHLDLLPGFLDALAPGGTLALQVPGNHDAPSHRTLRALADEEPYATSAPEPRPRDHDPVEYLEALAGPGRRVDAWETTYLHVLAGDDAVYRWLVGTGARPVLDALPADLRPPFQEELRRRLATAYPPEAYGTVLEFRRVFAVATLTG
ncbi:methyltransferase domain-containing protein [Cellulomonas sp. PhB143]|uniref:methyltransferase domain-containing protein n=1 Tax=Cellulomonas sp. PhB143 TaxID=2485186 RepID=UPI000F49A8EE|nr:methyltransferase domain-containing protein [Cellulomonas sp. PhB143]ROS78882.1 trans-aconitate 2-methyltransferase [Cellulomonas sp. PhB143]